MKLLCIALCVFALPADEAAFFHSLARRAFSGGDFEAATEAFLQVAEIAPSPSALYDVARSAQRAGRDSVAFSYYAQYLRSPEAEHRGAAQRALRRLRARLALVTVSSDPAGAQLWVDRRELGSFGRTPRTIVVEPGVHRVIVEAEGHTTVSREIRARAGHSVPLSVVLAPLEGELVVDAQPSDATVLVRRGDDVIAQTSSGESLHLPVGRYDVEVQAPGHRPELASVHLIQGRVERVRVVAAPRGRPVGRILVSAPERGVPVLIDGERRAETPATIPGVSVGRHTVEVLLGRGSLRREVVVEAGRSVLVRIRRDSR